VAAKAVLARRNRNGARDMMTSKEYRDTPEYGLIRRAIVEELVRVTDACINAPDMSQKEYNRGFADALKSILMLPDTALPQSDEPEEKLLEEEENTLGTILIANQPNDRSVF
jgi:hypothetical protein